MQVSKSRWGYHSTDYATFRKLRELHRWYWETVYAVARFTRWDRKTVHRHGAAPRYCPVFVKEQGHWEKFINRDGHPAVRYHAKTLVDHGIVKSLRAARMPAETPEAVPEIPLSKADIDRLYDEVKAWFEKDAHSTTRIAKG